MSDTFPCVAFTEQVPFTVRGTKVGVKVKGEAKLTMEEAKDPCLPFGVAAEHENIDDSKRSARFSTVFFEHASSTQNFGK